MRLATLNIRHGGGKRIPSLIAYIESLDADVLVLTEVRDNLAGRTLLGQLRRVGYEGLQPSSAQPRENGVLIASRLPISITEAAAGPPGQERHLQCADVGDMRVIACYLPQGAAKAPVFERLIELRRHIAPFGLILGDLNTGRPYEDEAGNTFACAEAFKDLLRSGLVDVWRARHPGVAEFSWFSAKGNGFRIDHALGTPDFDRTVRSASYLHESRLSGATDHAALLLEIDR